MKRRVSQDLYDCFRRMIDKIRAEYFEIDVPCGLVPDIGQEDAQCEGQGGEDHETQLMIAETLDLDKHAAEHCPQQCVAEGREEGEPDMFAVTPEWFQETVDGYFRLAEGPGKARSELPRDIYIQ